MASHSVASSWVAISSGPARVEVTGGGSVYIASAPTANPTIILSPGEGDRLFEFSSGVYARAINETTTLVAEAVASSGGGGGEVTGPAGVPLATQATLADLLAAFIARIPTMDAGRLAAILPPGFATEVTLAAALLALDSLLDETRPKAKRIQVVDDLVTIVGIAAPGALETAAVWRVFKVTKDSAATASTTSITWAGGVSTYSNIWADRGTVVFS